jgi:hypothetical protein
MISPRPEPIMISWTLQPAPCGVIRNFDDDSTFWIHERAALRGGRRDAKRNRAWESDMRTKDSVTKRS